MKNKFYIFLLLLLISPSPVYSHGGGLNSQGGHYNKKTGVYHCHQCIDEVTSSVKQKTTSQSTLYEQNSTEGSWAIGEGIHKLEKDYQESWCKNNSGKMEVIQQDRTRVDCITNTHAIEFDFGKKWAEAIGQALYYEIMTGKKAGVILILEQESDYKYWVRLNTVINHFNLDITSWVMSPSDLQHSSR